MTNTLSDRRDNPPEHQPTQLLSLEDVIRAWSHELVQQNETATLGGEHAEQLLLTRHRRLHEAATLGDYAEQLLLARHQRLHGDYALQFLLTRHRCLRRLRHVWLSGRIAIRGRQWDEQRNTSIGEPIEIPHHHDMDFIYAGKYSDLIHIAKYDIGTRKRLGLPSATWVALAITAEDADQAWLELRSAEIPAADSTAPKSAQQKSARESREDLHAAMQSYNDTGAPGRPPKGIHLCVREARSRRINNECERTVTLESRYLENWFRHEHSTKDPVRARSIENAIRSEHQQWKATNPDA